MKKIKLSRLESENGAGNKSGSEDFLVAGIGASAGGIQALKEFFENVPADSGVAYVVILHLSPDHESRLAEVLQTTARIPVTQVKERIRVEPNHVYVVPPNQHLEMLDGDVGVEENASVESRRAPVDIFFRTLAESRRAGAIAVVLSGTGADGSMGLKRVKERGGVVFVQNPREAEFSEMPRNSIATELVDQILNVGEIPAKIIAYKDNLGAVSIQDYPESRPENDQAALREIFAILRVRTGHDFSNYKHPTVLRRIERRINVRELRTLSDYAVCMRDNVDEPVALLKDLLISVTNFFRDKEAFQFLETEVVPRILQDKSSQNVIRVWVAGCATGEEAYSLAMLFCEQIEHSPVAPQIQIFATDIDEDAVAHAREGFYTLVDAADVSPERLRRFFTKEAGGFRVRREVREMILFARHNALKDPPFSHLDLVTCRNLLIYFNGTAQERAMETFHFALNPGSFLFLGSSESIDGAGDLYAPVNKEFRILQSRQAAKIAYPVPDAPNAIRAVEPKPLPPSVKAAAAGISREHDPQLERISFGDLHQQLLEQYAPPSIVVNENYDIVHLSPQAGRFLQIAGGEPSKNLLRLVRPELRLELRTALFQAVQRRANVVAANLKVRDSGHAETINIQVRPVLRTEDTARGFLLVIFEPSPNTDTGETTEKIIASDEPLTRRLEEELERTKTQLRTSIEQYEIQTEELRASNEELQAMNEELRSTAEELETSREQLQSVNEELMTVNQELKIKIEELSISNNDFKNLLNSTDIGTIFLDRALRVKMFTPAARDVFNLIDADINRPLADITTKIDFADLHHDVETVLDTLQTVEREFETANGKWYLMRVFPYRMTKDKISGAVVTFIEITNRIKNEHALQNLMQAREQQRRIFDTTLSTISDFAYIFDKEGRFIYSNRPLLDLLGITAEEIVGKNFFDLNYPDDLAARLQKQIQKVIDTKQVVRDETPFTNPDGRDGFYEYIFTPVFAADGTTVESVAGSTRDVTERKQAELELRENREHLQRAMKAGQIFSWELNLETREFSFSENMEAVLGFNLPARIIQNPFESNMHPEDTEIAVQKTLRSVETGEPYENVGRFVNPQTGEIIWLHSQGGIVTTADGRRVFAGAAQNITERKLADEALRESEEKYRTLFNSTDEGFYVIELLFDENDKAIDYRFVEANPAFEKFTGLKDVIGKTVREAVPSIEEHWIERYGKVALSGEPDRYGDSVAGLDDRWYEGYAFRYGDEESRQVAIIFNEITERKRAEEQLRRAAELDAFRVELNDRLRSLSDPIEIQAAAMRVIGERLQVDRALYADISDDGETIHIADNYVRGDFPKLTGDIPVSVFGETLVKMRRGETFIADDVRQTDEMPEAEKAASIARNILSNAAVPLVKAGRWVSNLVVHHGTPRKWTADEIALLQETAERTWAAVERARAEQARHETEERLTLAASVSGFGVHDFNAEQNKLYWSPELKAMHGLAPDTEINFETLTEMFHPDDRERMNRTMQAALDPQGDGEFEQEFRAVRRDTGEILWLYNRSRTTFAGEDKNRKAVRNTGIVVDITGRRRAEEAVHEAEKSLRIAVEAAGMGTWSWNVITNEVVWNEQHFALFGMTPKNVVKPDDFFNHVHPDDLEYVRENLERTLNEKVLFDVEFRALSEDDDATHWMSGYGQVAEEDENGRETRLSGLMFDITERKAAEEALRESETRFRATFEQANVGIVQISFDGQFLMVNPGFCKIIGYSEAELGKLKVAELTPPDDFEIEERENRRLLAGEISEYSIEKRCFHKSGSLVWTKMTATLVRDEAGKPIYMLSIVEDITERKAAEDSLRQSEERSRVLVEGATDFAILRISPDNLVESWNKGAEKVFGWTEDEIVGKPCDVLFTPEDREKGEPQKEIKTAAAKGRAEDERWHVRKDGTRFYASGVMTRLLEGAEGFVKIARDQTDKIEAEKAVRDREMLQKLVSAQEDERKRIARDLHDELGQKLTALRLKLENIRKICEEEALCGKIDEVQVLAKNIDADIDFLAWELRPAALDDLGLVAALTNYVNEWSRHAGVTIGFHAANLKRVRFQPEVETNLYRITQEALNNTHKHAKATRADILLERRDGSIVLIIEDDGKGFNVKDKKNRSKGIGLVGMQERAAIVGGALEIESAPDRGTTIFVRVPASLAKKEKKDE